MKSLGTRTTVLFVLVAFFSVSAHAYQLNTFRLRIEDPTTNVGRVITDNVSMGFLNSLGDQDSTAGTIHFAGTVGNFYVTVNGTSSTGIDGGGGLTLSANVAYNSIGADQIQITLEDTGYAAPAANAYLNISNVGGYDSSTNTVTPTGDLLGSATSISLQSWLDVAGDEPAFGANSGNTTLNPAVLTIPASATYQNSQQFTTSSFTGSASVPLDLSTVDPTQGYSIFSQVTLNFSGIGSADFSLSAVDPKADPPPTPTPEPTPLFLLGSALLGLGVLQGRKHA